MLRGLKFWVGTLIVMLSTGLSGCASTANLALNPLTAETRQGFQLADVKVSAMGNAAASADQPTLGKMTGSLRTRLRTQLAKGMNGQRPVIVKVAITKFQVNQRILSVTPKTSAVVGIVDQATGKTLATYTAYHEEPLGRVVVLAMGVDGFVAQQMALRIKNHIESKHLNTDRAISTPLSESLIGKVL